MGAHQTLVRFGTQSVYLVVQRLGLELVRYGSWRSLRQLLLRFEVVARWLLLQRLAALVDQLDARGQGGLHRRLLIDEPEQIGVLPLGLQRLLLYYSLLLCTLYVSSILLPEYLLFTDGLLPMDCPLLFVLAVEVVLSDVLQSIGIAVAEE